MPDRLRVTRLVIGCAAALCTVPYLTLKILWLTGNGVGFVDSAVVSEPSMLVLNAVTAAMDIVAIVVALAFTQSWGMRLPAWLVVFPMWVGTGLLGVIAVAQPISALGGEVSTGTGPVQPWVYTVVYSGFTAQGVLLGAAFLFYARTRWAVLFVAGQAKSSGTRRLQIGLANLGSALAVGVAVVYLVRMVGLPLGMPAEALAHMNFAAGVSNAVYGLSALAGAVGVQLVVRGRSGWTPLVLAWVGSGGLFSWGMWSMVNLLGGTVLGVGRVIALDAFTEFARVLAGTLLGVLLLFVMVERLAAAKKTRSVVPA
ncbi:hypothetical protein [Allokutzneria oryzae]|uniref:Uncharacterized protein n=1 Tax=Allokutzneria oryzae TaxID=1378989 RepID=A0ABV6A491_9PSEU